MRSLRAALLTAPATLVVLSFPASAPASAQAAAPTCHGEAATIVGTAGGDFLTGTPGRDVIVGLQGSDEIDA
ncbi:MAG: Hemolysin type calcium-binding protein, partial [Nocardioides sp.]|nr:Hemolysin type calcium-binding protein [Nocardioides sp.]